MKTQKQCLTQAWRIRHHETEDEYKQAKLVEWRGDIGLRRVGKRQQKQYIKVEARDDFLGGPVVKTSPSSAGGACSIPGGGAKIPHASQSSNQSIKQKPYCDRFNKAFKSGPYPKKLFFDNNNDKRNTYKIELKQKLTHTHTQKKKTVKLSHSSPHSQKC